MERQVAQRCVPRTRRRAKLERHRNACAIGRARNEVHNCDGIRACVHGWRVHSNLQGWQCMERQVAQRRVPWSWRRAELGQYRRRECARADAPGRAPHAKERAGESLARKQHACHADAVGAASSGWWRRAGVGQRQQQGVPLPERPLVRQDQERAIHERSAGARAGQPSRSRQELLLSVPCMAERKGRPRGGFFLNAPDCRTESFSRGKRAFANAENAGLRAQRDLPAPLRPACDRARGAVDRDGCANRARHLKRPAKRSSVTIRVWVGCRVRCPGHATCARSLVRNGGNG